MDIRTAQQFEPTAFAVTPAEDMLDDECDYIIWWNDADGSTHIVRVVRHPTAAVYMEVGE